MIYEDTFPVNFREFLIELVSGKFRKITYFGGVPSIDRKMKQRSVSIMNVRLSVTK